MGQSIVEAPYKAAIIMAMYCFFLSSFHIWLFRELRNVQPSKDSIILSFAVFSVGSVLSLLNALYIYYIDQPPITSGTWANIQDSQKFHLGLRNVWLPFSWLSLLIDLLALINFLVNKKIRYRANYIVIWFFAKILVDIIVIYVFATI